MQGKDTVKAMICEKERTTLCAQACLSVNSRGRDYPISEDDMRTDFQRDRDRIVHSKAFRRLMHKTQVFLAPEDDHYRTRLTHTLEVTQIARTIARSLSLNEDLAEAIALGHDLGHSPFGHAGERVLMKCFSSDYTHYKQSLRVVEDLEKLNLTYEVRNGIVTHAGPEWSDTLEGRAVRYADRIAYINHDIDDAIRAKVLSPTDIPVPLRRILGESHGKRIDTMVKSIVVRGVDDGNLKMTRDIEEATEELHTFLFANVYTNPIAKGEEARAESMLRTLYDYFVAHPGELPEGAGLPGDSVERRTADYTSGMTDRYAINLFKNLFIPETWGEGTK